MKNLTRKYVIIIFLIIILSNIFGFIIPLNDMLYELNRKFSLLNCFRIISNILMATFFLIDKNKFELSKSMIMMLLVIILFDRNIGITLAFISASIKRNSII